MARRSGAWSGVIGVACRSLATGALAFGAASAAAGADWPEIPATERSLKTVPGFPNAPAVVLFAQGRMVFDEEGISSRLEVYRRVKILTREGTEYGSMSLGSSEFFRVKELEARTHTPDGRIVELPKDAVFKKERSSYYNRVVTSFAMPEATEGAILEVRYTAFFDSVIYGDPWYFQSELPTLHSTITYVVPPGYKFGHDLRRTLRSVEVAQESRRTSAGTEVVYTAANVPAIPDEPSRFPFEDLGTRVIFLPLEYNGQLGWIGLLESWETLINLVQGNRDYGYKHFRLSSKAAAKKAKELVAGASTPREKACAVFRFVRDGIANDDASGVVIGERTGDGVLRAGRGDVAEKALLLQAMLDGAGISSSLAWANPLNHGRVNPKVPNPGQFETALVAAEVGGERLFLDPSDARIGCGVLPAELEGASVLLVDGRKPEWVTTPQTPPAGSRQDAVLDLAVSADGKVTGSGTLTLTGHHAYDRLRWKEDKEASAKAWTEWAADALSGFDVTGVEVSEDAEARKVEVKWVMAQREEAVLADEVALSAAAPLTLAQNPFVLPPERRMTPVQLSYTDVEQVELRLRWPEGWTPGPAPRCTATANGAGSLRCEYTVEAGARTLRATRTVEIQRREHFGNEYGELRALYAATAAADAEQVVVLGGSGR
ncbi:MAG: DUF3857 and transglutaminase domain-containing protein [Acidobacteria bacterium]|nr:DUF3857 and transglutaminase domain-containing protein [Acidobacteriota bacterium]